jgi:uncharacterized Ntn-hydrolase superfamily protein
LQDDLIATYSIVARDAATGQMGVAVQSCAFSVGSAVSWGEAGVGVVATQSFTNIDFGPEGLALLRSGAGAAAALEQLLARDPDRNLRQVALLDAHGGVAAHTGSRCIAAAGHQTGDGVSVQANMMTDDSVWPAMLAAYQRARGDLAARLLTALEAAEAAGGDIRGRMSAALLVVAGDRMEKPWQGRPIELRVEEHPQPLVELARLLRLKRAYTSYRKFMFAAREGRVADGAASLQETLDLAPELDEPRLSAAIGLYLEGRPDQALGTFRDVFARKPRLAEWIARMTAAGIFPSDPGLLRLVQSARSEVSR